MSISPLDSALFGNLLSDSGSRALFQDAAQIRAMLRFEAALALAEADCGVIPKAAAAAIANSAETLEIEPGRLAEGSERDGLPVPALVAALREAVGEGAANGEAASGEVASGEAAHYVHWGATSQDVMDTALVLRLRDLLALHEGRLAGLGTLLADLADRERHQVMLGRTRSQQAAPTSFGLKAAGWLASLTELREQLFQLRPRLLRLSFGGAVGTLSVLGDRAEAVERSLAARLDLAVAPLPWHSRREAILELGGWLSQVTAALGKMGLDLSLLAQSEVGEVRLRGGGSSTLPNKVNPISAESLIALARFNAAQLSALHQAALQEQERGGPGWTLEWMTLPLLACATGGALQAATSCLSGLEVQGERMRANLEAARGLPYAEAASFALSEFLPRAEAQAAVKAACQRALAGQRDLLDELSETTDAPVDWAALREPGALLGAADAFIDRALAAWRAS
jgi:3-carboxy-cis,cis-muconate cycloisomerase